MRPPFAPSRSVPLCAALLLIATSAIGCGGNVGAGPCAGDSTDPACETACDGDGDCPNGFFCGDEALCTAECTQGGNDCSGGQVCNSRGQCTAPAEDGGSSVDANSLAADADCPSVAVALEPQVPTVVLLVDRSGSMTTDFDGGLDRWDSVQKALTDPDDGVVTRLDSDVIFGATLYNSVDGGSVPDECPILHSVAPAIDNAGAINDLFSEFDPEADTPTAESVKATADSFPAADGPRIIVLATDGNPDTCEDSDAHDAASQALSETAVEEAYTDGIETFVLSVGDEVSEPHLQRLANAGQGEPRDTGTAPFYVANDQQEMIDAFTEILTGARSCQIELDGSVGLDRAGEGTVVLNGTELEYESEWQMVDADTIELLGGACDTFRETPEVNLQASFPCGIVVE